MTEGQKNKIGALLIGGAHGSLAVARSLGRHSIPIFFITDDHQIAKFSRYTTKSATWAGPDRAAAADELLALARRHHLEGWVLIPGGDADVRMIAQNHGKLASVFRVTTQDWQTIQWALDKHLTYQRAASLGLDHPRTEYPRNRLEVARLECRFPIILKPTTRCVANAFTLAKAWQVDDRATLLSRYDQAVALVGEQGVMLQEMIPGDGSTQYSYAAVWDRGQPMASMVARRMRQYPITIGYTSTMVQSIECKEVEEAGIRFLRSLDYSGIAEVEFKYDARDARYKILDVNARHWTWNALGGVSGVDFPYILWRIAMGETVAPVRGRAGTTWVHFARDLVAACQEMAAGRISPSQYVGSLHRPLVFAAFAADDPLPGLIDLPLLVWRLLSRRLPMRMRELKSSLAKIFGRARDAIFGGPKDRQIF